MMKRRRSSNRCLPWIQSCTPFAIDAALALLERLQFARRIGLRPKAAGAR